MTRLDVFCDDRTSTRSDVTLRSAPNWTPVLFFAALGMLHLYLATAAFTHGRIEGFLSLIFGIVFVGASIVSRLIVTEIAVIPSQRRIRQRFGWRRLSRERSIPFSRVTMVRLTLLHRRNPLSAHVEIVCDREVIECPPTVVPNEEALCLAVAMGVRLVKVYSDDYGQVSDRLDKLSAS